MPAGKRVQQAVWDGLDRWHELRRQEPVPLKWTGSARSGNLKIALRARPSIPSPDGRVADLTTLVADDRALSGTGNGTNPEPGKAAPNLAALPRRELYAPTGSGSASPRTMRLARPFRAGPFLIAKRMFLWLYGLVYFLYGTLVDKIRRRDSQERRAVRLRHMFLKVGGTFIKIGQQMSVRVDLLPYVYCQELGKLLDRIAPFPTEEAIVAIERATGQPLAANYTVFDPEPIGSASVACVYQALLENGEKVAIKVRRPGIGETFVADFRVLGWLFRLLEFLTILRPGFTENVLLEMRTTLMEELDFRKEARFQEIFRRRARKARRNFFTAPKVYPELSGDDVIVEEFVSGIWLSELLAAVEQEDQQVLNSYRHQGIDPKVVARRLLWVSNWGLWDSILFHADPHPANIIIQAKNKLVFIDFGSSGTLTESRRLVLHEIFRYENAENLEGISRLSLRLLEPLPPVDTNRVLKAIEEVYWDALIATRSKQSEWWERTSAQLWLGFFRVTSRFQIPMSFDTLRMIRATLLYDTLAARLDHSIDVGHHYRRFMEDAGHEARKRLQRRVRQRWSDGLTTRDYVRLERLLEMGDRLLYESYRLLNRSSFNFSALVGKFVSTVVLSLGFAFQIVFFTGLLVFGLALFRQLVSGGDASLAAAFQQVINNRVYQITIIFLTIINARRILFRLGDREV